MASPSSDVMTNGDSGTQTRTTTEPANTSPLPPTTSLKSTQPQRRQSSLPDMQPPPPKRQRVHNYDRRPRLSICPSVSPDAELVEDRDRNDNTLKGKFEAIFEKYGRDFTDVGDEINVMTGEVIVDNGHILSMQDEKDPGSPSRAKPRVSRDPTEVRSIAPVRPGSRSMTVGAMNVIASIEEMARRVATGQTPYSEDGEEDEEDAGHVYEYAEEGTHRSRSVSSDDSLIGGIGGDDYQDDWESHRSGSPDSLLGYEEHDSSIESFYEKHNMLPPFPRSTSEPKDEPVVLTSGPVSAPDLEVLGARPAASHGHPVSASFKPPSPPAFVKSNGKQKVIAKKFNVSRAYEELVRQASATPAATSLQPDVSQAANPRTKSSARPKQPKRPEIQREVSKLATRDTAAILRRLPLPRPSSEPRNFEDDYESDDPLQ